MKKQLFTLSLGVGALLLATQHAFAQGRNCGARDQIVDRLETRFGETRQSMGLGSNNALIELYASRDTGSWTLTMTMPNGTMCLMASGQSFETIHAEKAALKGRDA